MNPAEQRGEIGGGVRGFGDTIGGSLHLLGALAGGDVQHDPHQPGRATVLRKHPDDVLQPDHVAVGGYHAVFQFVGPEQIGLSATIVCRPVAILRVHVVKPERRLGRPALHGISQECFGLVAYEGELKRARVAPPQNRLDRLDQQPVPQLRFVAVKQSRRGWGFVVERAWGAWWNGRASRPGPTRHDGDGAGTETAIVVFAKLPRRDSNPRPAG